MNSDYMVFFPPLLLLLFLGWGCWKQRKNPLLPLAVAGGAILVIIAIGIGGGGIAIGAFGLVAFVVISAVIWTADKLF